MTLRRGAFAFAIAVLLTWPAPAHAAVAGPCTAEIHGFDLARLSAGDPRHAIDLERGTVVDYSGESLLPPRRVSIAVEYLGMIRWTVARKRLNGNERAWSSVGAVEAYAPASAGLHRVVIRTAGPRPCTATALIRLDGNPMSTPAGIGAAAVAALGLAGLARGGVRARRFGRLLPSPVAIVAGAATAVAGASLLQQYAVLYPTRTLSIALLAAGGAIGVVVPQAAQARRAHRDVVEGDGQAEDAS